MVEVCSKHNIVINQTAGDDVVHAVWLLVWLCMHAVVSVCVLKFVCAYNKS